MRVLLPCRHGTDSAHSTERRATGPAGPDSQEVESRHEENPGRTCRARRTADRRTGPEARHPDGAIELTTKIEAIDKTARLVTLKDKDGEVETIYCGPEVKRFDELKVGDTVTFRYHESVAYAIRKPGQPSGLPAQTGPAVTRGPGPEARRNDLAAGDRHGHDQGHRPEGAVGDRPHRGRAHREQ